MRSRIFLASTITLLFPSAVYAAEVFCFGNGDFVHEIFQAVATYCNSGDFATLLKMMATLALFAGLIKGLSVQAMGRGDILSEAFKTFLMVLLLYYICFVPKTSVIIRDEVFNTQTQVDNVPWGLAFMAQTTTSIEKSIAKSFDTVYTIPDDLKYTESGYNFGLLGLEATLHQGVINPYIQQNWSSYIADCVVPALLTGVIDQNALSWENDILGSDILATSYNNFYTTYYNPNTGQRSSPTCAQAYPMIKADTISHISNEVAPYYASRTAGIGGAANQWVTADVLNKLGAAGTYFLNLAGSGLSILQQAVMMNVINESKNAVLAQYSTNPGALQIAQAIASLQAQYALSTGAEMAKTYVPALRRILEGIVYGIFPIILAIAFIPYFRSHLLRAYFYLFFWLIWWSPIYSVINLIVTTRGHGVLHAYQGHFCLGNINPLANGFTDLVAVAGNLLWAVPMLSFFISTGSLYAAVAGFRSLGAHVASVSHGAGASVSPTPSGVGSLTRTGEQLTTKQMAETVSGISWTEMGQVSAINTPYWVHTQVSRMMGGAGNLWRGIVGNTTHNATKGRHLGTRTGDTAGQQTAGSLFGLEQAAKALGTTPQQLSQSVSYISGLHGYQRAEAIQAEARRLGVSTQQFVGAMEAAAYARAGEYLNQAMKHLNTGDITGAARYFSRYQGQMRFAGDLADKYKLDTVGTQGVAATRFREFLNEYGKFTAMQELYSRLFPSENPTQSFLQGTISSHRNRSLTLDDEASVDNLNELAKLNGWKTRFHRGDRVNLSWWGDKEGFHLSVARGEAGAERRQADFSIAKFGAQEENVTEEGVKQTMSGRPGGPPVLEKVEGLHNWKAPDGRIVTSAREMTKTQDGAVRLSAARYADGSYGDAVYKNGQLVYFKDRSGVQTPENPAQVVENAVYDSKALSPYTHMGASGKIAFANKFVNQMGVSQTAKFSEAQIRQMAQDFRTYAGVGVDVLRVIQAGARTFAANTLRKSLDSLNQRDYLYAVTMGILNNDRMSDYQKALALNYIKNRFGVQQAEPSKVGADVNRIAHAFEKDEIPPVTTDDIKNMTEGTPTGDRKVLDVKIEPGEKINISPDALKPLSARPRDTVSDYTANKNIADIMTRPAEKFPVIKLPAGTRPNVRKR